MSMKSGGAARDRCRARCFCMRRARQARAASRGRAPRLQVGVARRLDGLAGVLLDELGDVRGGGLCGAFGRATDEGAGVIAEGQK